MVMYGEELLLCEKHAILIQLEWEILHTLSSSACISHVIPSQSHSHFAVLRVAAHLPGENLNIFKAE